MSTSLFLLFIRDLQPAREATRHIFSIYPLVTQFLAVFWKEIMVLSVQFSTIPSSMGICAGHEVASLLLVDLFWSSYFWLFHVIILPPIRKLETIFVSRRGELEAKGVAKATISLLNRSLVRADDSCCCSPRSILSIPLLRLPESLLQSNCLLT